MMKSGTDGPSKSSIVNNESRRNLASSPSPIPNHPSPDINDNETSVARLHQHLPQENETDSRVPPVTETASENTPPVYSSTESTPLHANSQHKMTKTNIKQSLPPSKRNIICFGQLYFLEGISYGHLIGFLPLILTKYYDVNIAKISFMRITFLPWLLKPFFAKLFQQPNRKTVTKSWLSLVFVSIAWLFIYAFMDTTDIRNNGNTVYYLILFYGLSIQFCSAIFDVIVDFIQITTLKTRKTLGWVKTLETGLYKIGSMLAGPLLLAFCQSITMSLAALVAFYIVVGSMALFVFKLPDSCDEFEANLDSTEVLHNESIEAKNERSVSPKHRQNFWKSIYQTKYFFVYLVCYKMFQGSFQTLIPIWMYKQACIDLKRTNIVSGIIPACTSLVGTILGGGIPGKIMKQQKQAVENDQGILMNILSDIWFWLLTVMLVFSGVCFTVMTGVEAVQDNGNVTSTNCTETGEIPIQLNNVDLPITYIFGFLFIAISFIGGIITPVTFTEMTAKAQDNVHISQANSYLSWLSTFEIIGKYCWGLIMGSFVVWFGYPFTFLISFLCQAVTVICYCLNKHDQHKLSVLPA